MQISEAFAELVQAAMRDPSFDKAAAVQTLAFGDDRWKATINKRGEDAEVNGETIPGRHALIERDGWPLGLIHPFGGALIGGTEGDLIDALKAHRA